MCMFVWPGNRHTVNENIFIILLSPICPFKKIIIIIIRELDQKCGFFCHRTVTGLTGCVIVLWVIIEWAANKALR